MTFEEIKSLIHQNFSEAVIDENVTSSPSSLLIQSDKIHEVCAFLQSNERTYFDSLSCLTGIDNGLDADNMEVLYHLYSIPYDLHLALSVELPRVILAFKVIVNLL